MEYVDLFRATERHPREFAESATLREFAYSLNGSKPGTGRLLQHISDNYGESWELYYRTIKNHGFVNRPLLLPDARKVSDLLESCTLLGTENGRYLHETQPAIRKLAFIFATRAKGFAYSGHLGAVYGWSKSWLARGERLRAILRSNGYYATYGKPTAALVEAYGADAGAGDWNLSTLEAVQWDDGRILIVANCNNGFGRQWVAVLDAGENTLSLLGEHERGEVEADKEARLAAWGTKWQVSGTDRAQGAIGISEPFKVIVPAKDRDDAWQAAWNLRNAKGYGDNFQASEIIEIGADPRD